MKNMVPVPVMHSEGMRSFPMPNSKMRPHSLAFDRSQVEASGPWSSFVREAFFPGTGEELPRVAMWRAYRS